MLIALCPFCQALREELQRRRGSSFGSVGTTEDSEHVKALEDNLKRYHPAYTLVAYFIYIFVNVIVSFCVCLCLCLCVSLVVVMCKSNPSTEILGTSNLD